MNRSEQAFSHLEKVAQSLKWPVTPKSAPLKPVQPDQFWQKNLPKLVPQTTFAAKIGPAGPILAAKTGPLLPSLAPYKMWVCNSLHSYNYLADS